MNKRVYFAHLAASVTWQVFAMLVIRNTKWGDIAYDRLAGKVATKLLQGGLADQVASDLKTSVSAAAPFRPR